jgi:hypothetical protein
MASILARATWDSHAAAAVQSVQELHIGVPETWPVARFARICVVLKRLTFRLVLPAIVGAALGFFALALAVQDEPVIPAALLSLFSPGLKIAEILAPAKHESLASTFGGFLRVALGVNIAFYFAILALIAYLLDRRRSH